MRGRLLRTVVPVLVAVLALLVGLWAGVGAGPLEARRASSGPTALAAALDASPIGTTTLGLTDWDAVAERVLGGRATSADDRAAVLEVGSALDLTTRSVVADAADAMRDQLGFGPTDLAWEAYAVSGTGVWSAGYGRVGTGRVVEGLRSVGYTERDGVWTITAADLAAAGLPDVLTNVAVQRRVHVLVASPDGVTLRAALRGRHLSDVPAARQVADVLRGASSVLLEPRRQACVTTGFADATDTERAQAATAARRAGGLADYAWGARAAVDDGFRLAFAFGSGPVASRQAAVRADLSTGPLIGGSGRIDDVLTLRAARSSGPVTTLDYAWDVDAATLMSAAAPLLPAACAQ